MSDLKSDVALATNLLGRDSEICRLAKFKTRDDKALRLVPMRQQPNPSFTDPLISVWVRGGVNLGGKTTSNTLLVDIYTPLTVQRATGVGYDIAKRVCEVLDGASVGRGLEFYNIDPDRPTTTGWHKATVQFTFRSIFY